MKSYNQSSDERTEFKDLIFIEKIINNKKEGRGKFLFNDKETYEGEYENNLRQGKGIYYYKYGSIYDGE